MNNCEGGCRWLKRRAFLILYATRRCWRCNLFKSYHDDEEMKTRSPGSPDYIFSARQAKEFARHLQMSKASGENGRFRDVSVELRTQLHFIGSRNPFSALSVETSKERVKSWMCVAWRTALERQKSVSRTARLQILQTAVAGRLSWSRGGTVLARGRECADK